MRYALVTETYPPDINGVALIVQSLEVGLRARGHDVTLIRPRRAGETRPGPHQRLTAGLPLPWYPGLRFGLPAMRRLHRQWTRHRPDAIYVATEGPLGWSALRTAQALGIPAATGFHTRFDLYMRDYGLPLLQRPALAWMRHVHALGQATLVPTTELRHTLHAVAFTGVALAHAPALGWLLIPFAASVAVSRVVLGLHYPSDVIAATGIGGGLAWTACVAFDRLLLL